MILTHECGNFQKYAGLNEMGHAKEKKNEMGHDKKIIHKMSYYSCIFPHKFHHNTCIYM